MNRKPQPFWVKFQVLGYIVGGLAALGTVIVVSNKYIVLPQRVDANEQAIDDLKGWAKEIQGYTRAMKQQQDTQQQPKVWKEHGKGGEVWCTDGADTWAPNRRGDCE